jgi:hypothetical protein
MTQEEKQILLQDLTARLPYGVRGKVKADTVVPHKYDIDGFPLETTFDVDVELQRIDASNDEIFVSTFDNNEDLGNYIEECQSDIPYTIEEFTPYLRSMSSMTEEERKEFSKLLVKRYCEEDWEGHISTSYCIEIDNVYTDDEDGIKYPSAFSMDAIDWLNAHHFDYRGLIEKNLALDCTGLHIYD